MLEDIKADETYERSSVKPLVENVGETGCQDTAFQNFLGNLFGCWKQNTNDDPL